MMMLCSLQYKSAIPQAAFQWTAKQLDWCLNRNHVSNMHDSKTTRIFYYHGNAQREVEREVERVTLE